MSAATNKIVLGAIRRNLEEAVLPALSQGWPASYVRSSLVLLTMLEHSLDDGDGLSAWELAALTELTSYLRAELDVGETDGDAEIQKAAAESDDVQLAALRLELERLVIALYEQPAPSRSQGALDRLAAYRNAYVDRRRAEWMDAARLPII